MNQTTSLASGVAALRPWIEAQFPQLRRDSGGRERVYFDSAAGTLTPQRVADAMAHAAVWANPQPERGWPAAADTATLHAETRAQLREFVGATEGRISVTESSTAALFKLRQGLEEALRNGNVVTTDCDHYANVSAWEWRPAWEVRRARVHAPEGTLDLDHLASLLDERTGVVAVTAASNGLGTRVVLPRVSALVRQRAPRARIVVDAVHTTLHAPVDARAWDVDAIAFSTYKLFGPLAGVLWINDRLAAEAEPYHVRPNVCPEYWFEWGTLNNATVAGIRAALNYLAEIGSRLQVGGAREAVSAIEQYESRLAGRMLRGLAELPHVRSFGITDPARLAERVPTFAFAVEGIEDPDVVERLWTEYGLQVAYGNHYAAAVLDGLGRRSVLRASFAHYTTPDDVDRLLAALRALV